MKWRFLNTSELPKDLTTIHFRDSESRVPLFHNEVTRLIRKNYSHLLAKIEWLDEAYASEREPAGELSRVVKLLKAEKDKANESYNLFKKNNNDNFAYQRAGKVEAFSFAIEELENLSIATTDSEEQDEVKLGNAFEAGRNYEAYLNNQFTGIAPNKEQYLQSLLTTH